MLRLAIIVLGLVWAATAPASAKSFAEMFPQKSYEQKELQAFLEALDYKQGTVPIGGADVTLTVPDGYYFLDQKDATRVLVELWGNPPAAASAVLGMIFTASATPYDDTWGAVVSFDNDGYVTDENAGEIDYDALLKEMQSDTEAANAARREQGFEPVTLIGWASQPFYERDSHKLHWAKELRFGTVTPHTLNYNVRVLGRHGVLNINFVSEVDKLAVIRNSIPAVMDMPRFDEGARYADYIPGTDKVAAYGIGGLIAGKVLSKAGILAVLLAFLKKGWIFIVLALGGLFTMAKRFFQNR